MLYDTETYSVKTHKRGNYEHSGGGGGVVRIKNVNLSRNKKINTRSFDESTVILT